MGYQIINTWNGGEGGKKVVFSTEKEGNDGYNLCFEWIHRHTPFSVAEALKNQGYEFLEVADEQQRTV